MQLELPQPLLTYALYDDFMAASEAGRESVMAANMGTVVSTLGVHIFQLRSCTIPLTCPWPCAHDNRPFVRFEGILLATIMCRFRDMLLALDINVYAL